MPTASEIAKYLKAAVLFKSGRPRNWPPQRTSINQTHDQYLVDRVSQARSQYGTETGYKTGRKGLRKEQNIPVSHATGILGIIRRWATDTNSDRQTNFEAAGITAESVDLATIAMQEDFDDTL